MFNKNEIDSIFDPDFDINQIDPADMDTTFIITAIMNNHQNLINLDPYLKDLHFNILMYIFIDENREFDLVKFFQKISIQPKLEQIILKKLRNDQVSFARTKVLSFNWSAFSYKKSKDKVIINYDNKNSIFASIILNKFCEYLLVNKDLPHSIIKEIEVIYEQYIELCELSKDNSSESVFVFDTWNENMYQEKKIELKNLRKHKNYSLATYILNHINSKNIENKK